MLQLCYITTEEKKYADFFILNGNIYFKLKVVKSACERTVDCNCCTIEKLKRFITKTNISQFFKCRKKIELEIVSDLLLMAVESDNPVPVLYREEQDIENNNGLLFQFGDNAFISDESERYEFYILYDDTWIIQDIIDGNIRVWNRTMEELFFGKESEYVFEKNDNGEYIQVVV